MISPRRCAAALLVPTTVAGLLFAAATGPATAAPRPAVTPAAIRLAPYVGGTLDLGITTATAMVTAQNKLFIASGNSVLIRSLTGAALGHIDGEFGVSELLVSADRLHIYAADAAGSAISLIDPVAGTETAHWTVQACPTHLALAGTRLFYSYGCDQSSLGIASVDAATGTDQAGAGVTISAVSVVPPLLAATAGRVVEMESLNPATVTSFSQNGAALTAGASISVSDSSNLRMSPDGKSIAMTTEDGYQVIQYDAGTLAESASFATGPYPTDVAYDSASDKLVGGVDDGDRSIGNLQVFSTKSGSEVAATSADGFNQTWLPMVLARSLTFGPDLAGRPDAVVYGLLDSFGGNVRLATGPASPLSIAHMTVGVSSPAAYGKPLAVSVTFPGHANVALTLKVLPNSGSPIYVPVRTNKWGVATASIKVNFTGRVYAYYGGDLMSRHEAPTASAIHAFTVPTRMAVSMLGAYKSSGGVLYFHSGLNVHLHVLVGPPHTRQLSVVLQAFVGGRWVSRPTAVFTTNQWGTVDLYLNNGAAGILFRTLVSTPTSVFNLGSSGIGAAFKLG